MAFSKVVLLVVFAILLISAEVSALRDLAETTSAPTLNQGGKPGKVVECSKHRYMGCTGNRAPIANCKMNPYSRDCDKYGNGRKGGGGAPGPKTEN